MPLYETAVSARLAKELTYSSNRLFRPGDLVEVPLMKKIVRACILRESTKGLGEYEIKEIKGKIYEGFRIGEKEMALFRWMADYYHYPLGKLIFDSLPKEMPPPKAVPFIQGKRGNTEPLNSGQEAVYQALRPRMAHGFSKALIHGVTGSGKTRIYKKLMNDILGLRGSVLFLLPEINLTPQFLEDFRESFNCPIYSYNSGLSPRVRYEVWKRLASDSSGKIVVGVRSSLFLPILGLQLIIVDEEHDSSFKQGDRCPYNARDTAVKKASLSGIPIVLGSATPAVETYHAFQQEGGKNLFRLKKRAESIPLPEIHLIDEKSQSGKEEFWPFKEDSLTALSESTEKGEKAIVFINRLGYSSILQCRFCSRSFECPHCSVGLKFYKSDFSLKCHHCGHREKAYDICPDCGCVDIFRKGFGTEKVEEVLKKRFPQAVVARFDRGHIKTLKGLQKMMGDFAKGRIHILVGTQMLSKGHNFKDMNTAVILGTDSLLNFPDFKAQERVYQTLTQVAGRSGRYARRGRVYIQTMAPDHPMYQTVKEGDFDEFYRSELALRESYGAPPFKRVGLIYLTAPKKELLEREGPKMKGLLDEMKERFFKGLRILGPRPSFVEKRAGKYTWNLMIESGDINELHNGLNSLAANYRPSGQVSYRFDIDPYLIG